MERGQSNLFEVYLRLRPAKSQSRDQVNNSDRYLTVDQSDTPGAAPTHITLNPPNDRRRAVEKFVFTQVFQEDASQLDVFHCTGVAPLVEGVVCPHGSEGTDALIATLGVTGSGKTHTMLGSRTQRGLTQLALEVLFRSIRGGVVDCFSSPSLESSINLYDASEANIVSAQSFCDSVFGDLSNTGPGGRNSSRAPTPMMVRTPADPSNFSIRENDSGSIEQALETSLGTKSSTVRLVRGYSVARSRLSRLVPLPHLQVGYSDKPSHLERDSNQEQDSANTLFHTAGTPKLASSTRYSQGTSDIGKVPSPAKDPKRFMALTVAVNQQTKNNRASTKIAYILKNATGDCFLPPTPTRRQPLLQRPSVPPAQPDITHVNISSDPGAEYVVLISMYEVYNDRIFDLLSAPIRMPATKELRRRPLLFKSTEHSPDRKVVAGLKKVVCTTLKEALMVLDAAIQARRVAGTGSNNTSSRSHGFFCVEVKKRPKGRHDLGWSGSTLTIVDLAGSERARDAKTAGATLQEAGKINESLMYLGQCLQMQSGAGNNNKPNVVPFRQCKLTELLFSNSFPSGISTNGQTPSYTSTGSTAFAPRRRNPQKGVMIVTADPLGDFNATSQILRYSALAREITVPRIPSITSAILAATPAATPATFNSQTLSLVMSPSESEHLPPSAGPSDDDPTPVAQPSHARGYFPPQPTTPGATQQQMRHLVGGQGHSRLHDAGLPSGRVLAATTETMQFAAMEIARLHEELEDVRAQLAMEQDARVAAEAHLESTEESMEERMLELEMSVRDEVSGQFEERLREVKARTDAFWQDEVQRREELWNRKLEALGRGLRVYDEDDIDDDNNAVTSSRDSEGYFDLAVDSTPVRSPRPANATATDATGDLRLEPDFNKENQLVDENPTEENKRLRREVEVLKREVDTLVNAQGERHPLRERGIGSGSGSSSSSSKLPHIPRPIAGSGNKQQARDRPNSPLRKEHQSRPNQPYGERDSGLLASKMAGLNVCDSSILSRGSSPASTTRGSMVRNGSPVKRSGGKGRGA